MPEAPTIAPGPRGAPEPPSLGHRNPVPSLLESREPGGSPAAGQCNPEPRLGQRKGNAYRPSSTPTRGGGSPKPHEASQEKDSRSAWGLAWQRNGSL